MDEKIIEIAAKESIWVVLTVALIFYILRSQEKRDLRQEEREVKYQNIISNLSDKLNSIEDIKDNICKIKNFVFQKQP